MQYISVQHDVTSIDKCILRTCKHLKMLMTNGKVKDGRGENKISGFMW